MTAITKLFPTGVTTDAVLETFGTNPHTLPHRENTAVLQEIHMVTAHPLFRLNALFAFWLF